MTNKHVPTTTTDDGRNSYVTALINLEHRVENMFENMWHNPFSHEEKPAPHTMNMFEGMPKLDLVDRKKEVLVKAELPGFAKKDIDVSVTGTRLVIKAKACHEEKVEEGNFLKQEISKSEVYRSLALPTDVDDKKIKTSFKNGVLKLRIQKRK